MTRPHFINLLVLLVTIAIGYWFISNTQWVEESRPQPLTGEAAIDPYYAARLLVKALGAHAQTLPRLDRLPPPNTTLVLSSHFWNLFSEQEKALHEWVKAGGHLVLDADLLDTASLHWIGVKRVYPKRTSDAQDESSKEVDVTDEVTDEGVNPYFDPETLQDGPRCRTLEEIGGQASSSSEPRRISLCTPLHSRLEYADKTAWRLQARLGSQVIRIAEGRGKVTVFNTQDPFTYRGLLFEDHAQYFVAVTDLQRGDSIWFIPFEEGTPLLKLMWQKGAAVIVVALLAIAAALWRATPRFGPLMALPHATRRSLRDQIVGSGEFVRRTKGQQALLHAQQRALDQLARRRIAGYETLSMQDRLAAIARACQFDAAELGRALAPEADGATALEAKLHALESVRRRLAAPRKP